MNFRELFLLFLALFSLILGAYLVPYIKSVTTAKQRENTYFLIQLAVKAVEQIFPGHGIGDIKKDEVLKYLEFKGIYLTDEDLEILIEAAVRELNILQEKLLE